MALRSPARLSRHGGPFPNLTQQISMARVHAMVFLTPTALPKGRPISGRFSLMWPGFEQEHNVSFNQLKSQRQELDEHCRVLKQGAKWFQHAYRSFLSVVSLLL